MKTDSSIPFFLLRNWNPSTDQIEGREISKDLKNHFKSLRLKPQSQIQISNGLGKVFTYLVEKPDFTLKLLTQKIFPRSSPQISLFLSPPRGDALWDSVSFATQLSCNEIYLVESDFGELSKKAPRTDIWERLERVADAASESCKRPWAIEFPKKDWLQFHEIDKTALQFDQFFVCNENLAGKKWGGFGNSPVKKQTGSLKIGILIGPEGGWSQEENKYFSETTNLKPLFLGPQVLKVPVAVCAALTLCQAFFEEK